MISFVSPTERSELQDLQLHYGGAQQPFSCFCPTLDCAKLEENGASVKISILLGAYVCVTAVSPLCKKRAIIWCMSDPPSQDEQAQKKELCDSTKTRVGSEREDPGADLTSTNKLTPTAVWLGYSAPWWPTPPLLVSLFGAGMCR